MFKIIGRVIKFRLPLIYHKIFPPEIKYKGFSTKVEEEFDKFVNKRLDHPLKKQSLNWLSNEEMLENNFRLLDLGCGPGVFAQIIRGDSDMRDRIQYTGIDQSSKAIQYCRNTLPENYNFICQDFLSNGIPEDYYEVIAINEVLEHIYSYDKLISKVLKRKPKILIITSFAILPEYKRDRRLWRSDTECYMNSYSFYKFYRYLREKTNGVIFVADFGVTDYERYWFPQKASIAWYIRLTK